MGFRGRGFKSRTKVLPSVAVPTGVTECQIASYAVWRFCFFWRGNVGGRLLRKGVYTIQGGGALGSGRCDNLIGTASLQHSHTPPRAPLTDQVIVAVARRSRSC